MAITSLESVSSREIAEAISVPTFAVSSQGSGTVRSSSALRRNEELENRAHFQFDSLLRRLLV